MQRRQNSKDLLVSWLSAIFSFNSHNSGNFIQMRKIKHQNLSYGLVYPNQKIFQKSNKRHLFYCSSNTGAFIGTPGVYRVSQKKLPTFRTKYLWKYEAKKVSTGVFEKLKCIVTFLYTEYLKFS